LSLKTVPVTWDRQAFLRPLTQTGNLLGCGRWMQTVDGVSVASTLLGGSLEASLRHCWCVHLCGFIISTEYSTQWPSPLLAEILSWPDVCLFVY